MHINLVYELELWSKPGKNLDQDFGKEELQEIISIDLPLDENIYIGLSYIPDETDVKILEIDIRERRVELDDFLNYCKNNRLSSDLSDPVSAALYLEYQYGRGIAWLHLPCNQTGKFYLSMLVDWSKKNGYVIVNTDFHFCVIDAEGWDEFLLVSGIL